MTEPTTRQTQAALADIARIRQELDWLGRHLPDLDIIANSAPWQPGEQVPTGARRAIDTGPVLSEQGQPRQRRTVTDVCQTILRSRITLTAARVALEAFYAGPGADHGLIGTLLEPGELEAARAAKGRRDAHAGDPRWGEWEASPATQPGRTFKGGS